MRIAITKGDTDDLVAIRREDGSYAQARVPKKGPVPHDAVHYFVETGLNLAHGFWGHVAQGLHPDELVELAKAGGHASASRAEVPDAAIVELVQAERLVESFEADLWSGGGEEDDILAMARAGCATAHVALPSLAGGTVEAVRSSLMQFACDWIDAPVGHVVQLRWACL